MKPYSSGADFEVGTSDEYVDLDFNIQTGDIDLYGSNPSFNVTRNLTATSTDAAVVVIKQDHASDTRPALKLEQDASSYNTLDVQGWTNLGYTSASPGTGETGSLRVVRATDESNKWFLAVTTAGGSLKYVELSATSTA
jgi:hypothetical protein